MEYNKELLEEWSRMEDWGDHMDRIGALEDWIPKEVFQYYEREYFEEVEKRIVYCKRLLEFYDDELVYYTLAELYNRCNPEESEDYLYKRKVIYYCLKALKINRHDSRVYHLMNEAYNWIDFIRSVKEDSNEDRRLFRST